MWHTPYINTSPDITHQLWSQSDHVKISDWDGCKEHEEKSCYWARSLCLLDKPIYPAVEGFWGMFLSSLPDNNWSQVSSQNGSLLVLDYDPWRVIATNTDQVVSALSTCQQLTCCLFWASWITTTVFFLMLFPKLSCLGDSLIKLRWYHRWCQCHP